MNVDFSEDFNIGGDSVMFDSSSTMGSQSCLTFMPVNDGFVEDTEIFTFQTSSANMRDTFAEGSYSDPFSLSIFDDDGMTIK